VFTVRRCLGATDDGGRENRVNDVENEFSQVENGRRPIG
jgi:hypothetical protein